MEFQLTKIYYVVETNKELFKNRNGLESFSKIKSVLNIA
jgi:hypothetical protein